MKHKVGVIGGGQLAWMMGAEARSLGMELWVQTPNASDPAVSNADQVIIGAIDDLASTAKLVENCHVVTFENEFVDLEALDTLVKRGAKFFPSLPFLAALLDKYDQRRCCQRFDIPVPTFVPWQLGEPLPPGWEFPLVVKARRHGYDGKGTFIVKDAAALQALPTDLADTPLLLEAFVPFEQELAVMVTRNRRGEIRTFPTVETQQIDQVCRWVLAPAAVPQAVVDQVEKIAHTLAEGLNLVGIMGIELFLTPEGQVLVNEIAPRTHNSGHFSLDACQTSQFAMQLQAIADLPLGNPKMLSAGAVMVNLLGFEHSTGDYAHKRQMLTQFPQSHIHWYNKTSASPGRKLGHVTVLSETNDRETLMAIAKQIETIWYGNASPT
ncbi:5-(carboxyamino)imidazole ribonucleotide synthase [Picosynechococcus sp. PCC 7003]|uniref:5-(carboxyamino)imidazole ribonucleotide synthase n=1 Tax=Picosynechococcus sp. PCC 7003 TaxID=374981 RepID=UPI0008104CC3|nr:5-(carboxyamino)imidazole ribonucleotide synthase [Picosynechococcus sp. PCC 7003]ANV83466.1 5-(carboxyamino)imidazole ribonucleotide synthase [Picosynechococcus sp. PCC 7003]